MEARNPGDRALARSVLTVAILERTSLADGPSSAWQLLSDDVVASLKERGGLIILRTWSDWRELDLGRPGFR